MTETGDLRNDDGDLEYKPSSGDVIRFTVEQKANSLSLEQFIIYQINDGSMNIILH